MKKHKEPIYTSQDLAQMQAFPLDRKVQISQTRILEWILKTQHNCAVSFSGGKDSTVLLDLVRRIDENIPAIFANTGLEFPEVRQFALSKKNVIEVRPEMSFGRVLRNYGYPFISKEISLQIQTARKLETAKTSESRKRLLGQATMIGKYGDEIRSIYNCEKWLPLSQLPIRFSQECCKITKELPIHKYQKQHKLYPIIGTMASESRRREKGWRYNGCNAFDISIPRSAPLSFWTEQDILRYILRFDIEIPSVYGDIIPISSSSVKSMNGTCLRCTGRQRTGCIYCGYGAHLEAKDLGETRFQMLSRTHPQLYDYCMRGGEWIDNPDYDATIPVYADGGWLNWNPKKILVPSSNGLGYRKVLDMINSVYGKNFIEYE